MSAKVDQALAALRLGQPERAERLLANVLRKAPHDLEALILLSGARARQGRLDDAVALLRRAAKGNPDNAEAQYNLGIAWGELGSVDQSIACYRNALRIDPHHLQACGNLGATLLALKRWHDALSVLQEGSRHHAGNSALLGNMGVALKEMGCADAAIHAFRQAICLEPGEPYLRANLGLTLQQLGHLDEAIDSFRTAVSLDPQPHYRSLLALALYEKGEVEAAIRTTREAIALCPDDPDLHANLGMMLLASGRFAEGWAEREFRPGMRRPHPDRPWTDAPFWKGESLAGKAILVHAEQGLGDTLQFSRYLPLLTKMQAEVTFACQATLIPLVSSLGDDIRIVIKPPETERFDFQVALLSLPYRLGTDASNVPCDVPYLAVAPAAIESWRRRIHGRGLAVGISWQGNPEFVGDRERSIPLHEFAPLAEIPGVSLISLQRGAGVEQIGKVAFGHRIMAPLDPNDVGPNAATETAALVMNCGLVVTSCTMVAHLAGALARPVFVALRQVPDWRWLLAGDDSAWYPTARLFRQQSARDWSGVFGRIAAEISVRAAGA
jgi:Flp pilus assembly protein TadD